MTTEQIKNATNSTQKNAEIFQPHIEAACEQYNILASVQQLAFLAQVGHESAGLFYTEELASGQDYEMRTALGNTEPGDGKKYKGRGLIQITGRANYKEVGEELNMDLINNPELLGAKNINSCSELQLSNAALSAAWFWNSRALNDIALKIDISKPVTEGNNILYFKKITKAINGGYNGLEDRIGRYENGRKYFV